MSTPTHEIVGTSSGRFQTEKPNVSNIPGSAAHRGVVEVDFAKIETRILSYLAGHIGNGTEETLGGDCYRANGGAIVDSDIPGALLVHGDVAGQGKLTGVRFGHCWVEFGDVVMDVSNDKRIYLRKEVYYALGEIKEDELIRYTREQFRQLILEHEHWGPF